MSRFYFLSLKFVPVLLIAFGAITSASGQVTLSPDPPVACSSLAENLSGGVGSRIFDELANANHARGQIFEITAGPSEITAITIRSAGLQTFANDVLTVRIFEGTAADFDLGTGHTTAANGMDYFNGTGPSIAEISLEAFTLNGEIADDDFITFTFSTPVPVDNGSYGFLMTYTQVDGELTNLFYLENQADLTTEEMNGRIAVLDANHVGNSVRGFNYAVLTTPTSAGLADVNRDFAVDFLDIAPFIDVLAQGLFQCEADVDQSGEVDFLDIPAFIALLSGT